jgi:hypothetical protein
MTTRSENVDTATFGLIRLSLKSGEQLSCNLPVRTVPRYNYFPTDKLNFACLVNETNNPPSNISPIRIELLAKYRIRIRTRIRIRILREG